MRAAGAMIALFVVAGLAAAGGAPGHEAVVKKMLATLDGLTKSLGTITDAATAEAAKPELRKEAKEWVALKKETEKLPPPSREEKTRLEKEFKSKLEAAQRKLFGEVGRVQKVPGGNDALQEIRGVLTASMK